jgi:DNA (cytosine-5)-methyltransferase 1
MGVGGMKILNLYAGIGGNRKLWKDVNVTAVEMNPDIAKIYQDFFPNDKVIVGDAHEYLLKHFEKFDFIWASPPCQTHSRLNLINVSKGVHKPRYADMSLYQKIILLKQFFKGKYCVENVVTYYKPLIRPQYCGNHYLWANFFIKSKKQLRAKIVNFKKKNITGKNISKGHGLIVKNWHGFKGNKDQVINNCIEPELGLHILNESKRDIQPELFR